MEVDSWLTGRRGVSLPFTDHCDPLAQTRWAFEVALTAMINEAQKRRWKYFELRGGDWFKAPESASYFGHVLPLQSDDASTFSGCRGAVRQAVRKAERSGVEVIAIDQDTRIYPLPRAVHFDHEIMRLFQGLGIGAAYQALANGRGLGLWNESPTVSLPRKAEIGSITATRTMTASHQAAVRRMRTARDASDAGPVTSRAVVRSR